MVERIEGFFYEPNSSRHGPATLMVGSSDGLELLYEGGSIAYPKGSYTFEPPLGSLKRVIHLASESGAARFETSDHVSFKELESALNPGSYWGVVAWLEGHWRGTLASVLAVAFFAFAFLEWGIPTLAKKVASDMPQSWRRGMTEQSLEFMLDLDYVKESGLAAERVAEIEALFQRSLDLAKADRETFDYELRLYEGGAIGANAFAFPSGVVVATDEFVALCENDDQLLAVFLHEIEHVEEQHGVRALLQRGGVFLVFSLLIGDASSVISLAEGLPALVLNSRYSQVFELESDSFAAEVLEESGVGAEAMEEILVLLHRGSPDVPLAEFLSTHPGLQDRLENIVRIREMGTP